MEEFLVFLRGGGTGFRVDGRIDIVVLYQIHIVGVDGRIVIVALYQVHTVGVRSIFPGFDRNLVPLWS